jgi:DNA polymerase I-like protein with 3'-5' exonuclease and polymerase domains
MTGMNKEAQMLETIQIPLAHREGQNAEMGMSAAIAEFCSTWNLGAFWVQSEAASILRQFKVRGKFVDDPYIQLRLIQDSQVASLKDAVAKYLGTPMTPIESVIPVAGSYDFSLVHAQDEKGVAYSKADSYHGFQLARVLDDRIEKSSMLAVYRVEVHAAAIMAEMTLKGYDIDMGVLATELDNEDVRLERLQESVYRRLGCEPFPLNSTAKLGIAFSRVGIYSPVKTKKTEKGGGGNDSWAKPVLEMMVREGLPKEREELFNEIIEWKSSFSTRNTLRKSPARVAADGKIHPIWKSIGFDGTARMYAEEPSITSLPMGCRRAMRAPKGKRWMKFDWKQAELRALAGASQDKNLMEMLNSGVDIHKAIYAKMKGMPIDEVTHEQRESSKVISYSVLYSGGSPYHVASHLAISTEAATALVRDYFATFPTLRIFLDHTREQARRTYHVRTFMNRLRRLDGKDDETRMNQACDAMGQQTIGTALKIALAKMAGMASLGHPCMAGLCQIIPVFDAIFYCINDDIPILKHIDVMKDLVQLNLAGVVLEAEFEHGPTSWGDMRPVIDEFAQAEADLMSGGQAAIERLERNELPRDESGAVIPPSDGKCQRCKGHGYTSKMDTCPVCLGTGREMNVTPVRRIIPAPEVR